METIYLWPDKVPHENSNKKEAVISDDYTGNVTRITEVTNPLLTIYKPKNQNNSGIGIIICPGGGYRKLAIDKEGSEVAEWLNELGYTAFVLQYRVPNKLEGALNDIQRAMRIIRTNSTKFNLNSNRIGVLGFSAGGDLAARISTNYNTDSYSKVDTQDEISSRPDFSILIYPAYLDKGINRSLSSHLEVDENTPPMFIFATSDDNHANSSLVMTTALRDFKVPVELHLLPTGGHGYGLRLGNNAAIFWPNLAEKWIRKTINTQP